MCAAYYARTSDHGYETCAEHLAMAGCLAGGFAKGFGYLDDGLLAGLVHDLGKYSDAFQRRIRNPDHCGPVDHSTAGALLLMRHACPLAAMAVAGHHAGLPDLGSYGELEGPTFMSRMNRARRAGDCNPLALAQAGETQLDIPQSAFLHGTRSAKPMTSSKRSERWSPYTDMMLTRMLFSALVDADRLDAEFFTRTFGAVMTTFVKGSLSCGQVRGPVQLGFARSIDPISVQEISITRIAVTTEADAAEKNNTMGNKFIIPYGLYRMNGYISAKLAQNVTGFCDEDLDVLWQAILNMFEFDRSAARGNMAVRKLYVFKHSSALGDAPSWKLFDSINVHKRAEVDAPRDFADYEVRVNREAIPESVSLTEMVDHAL